MLVVKTQGLNEFKRFMKSLEGRVKDPGRAMRACSIWAAARVKKYFSDAAARAADGISWKPKSPLWARWQGKSKPLWHTGTLARSISHSSGSRSFAYGTNVDYAEQHNEGTYSEKKKRITVWLKLPDKFARRPGYKAKLEEHKLATPDEQGAFKYEFEQKIYKRPFIIYPPPPAYIRKWQEIIGGFFMEGKADA